VTEASRALRQLARLHDVQTTYTDIRGKVTAATPEGLCRVLAHLGAPLRRPDEAGAALRARRLELWRRGLPPAHVAWEGRPGPLRLRLRSRRAEGTLRASLHLEDGERREVLWDVASLRRCAGAEIEGEHFLEVEAPLPSPLPPGVHRLEAGDRACWILSAPLRAWSPRRAGPEWGVFTPLYALHSDRSWGTGDLTDYGALLRWTRERGGGTVGTLPLLAAFLGWPGSTEQDRPFEPSPYAPASRLFWNELYLDPTRCPEFATSPEARALVESAAFAAELDALRRLPLVDYRRCMAVKRRVLELLAGAFHARPGPGRADALARYLAARPEAEAYARFRATVEHHRGPWPTWPQQPEADDEVLRYHLYVQWAMDEQIHQVAPRTAEGGGLYLDLPLGVHPDGYDVWADRASFALEAAAGAPPDSFFTAGQNWGFSPLHAERIRENGYAYLRACLAHHLQAASTLRIDHVMSLHRLFWIPSGMETKDGVYVRYKFEEMYAVLSLASVRNRSMLVGEDLGLVPPPVRPAMRRHGVLGMHVVQYALQPDPAAALAPPAPDSVASLNTHDMPPFAAWLEGLDIADRQDLGLLDASQAAWDRGVRDAQRRALLAFLHGEGLPAQDTLDSLLFYTLVHLRRQPEALLLVNLEDLWLETSPQNVPGTALERPNWRRKLRHGLEQLRTRAEVLGRLRAVAPEISLEGTR
jgi:4-alpha-glucanotransferase